MMSDGVRNIKKKLYQSPRAARSVLLDTSGIDCRMANKIAIKPHTWNWFRFSIWQEDWRKHK